MSGESLVQFVPFVEIAASDQVINDGWSDSTKTTLASAFPTGQQADYALVDFKMKVTAGIPTDGGSADIYFHPSDGTDQAPNPGDYTNDPPHYVGSFVFNDELGSYYCYQSPNLDKNGTYTWKNKDGAVTITATLYARMRAFNQVP